MWKYIHNLNWCTITMKRTRAIWHLIWIYIIYKTNLLMENALMFQKSLLCCFSSGRGFKRAAWSEDRLVVVSAGVRRSETNTRCVHGPQQMPAIYLMRSNAARSTNTNTSLTRAYGTDTNKSINQYQRSPA